MLKKHIYFSIILLFALVLFSFLIGSYPLIGVDEPRYAEAAREMLERGDIVEPYLHYEPRYDKPILFYWEEILSFKAFGVTEFAARLPSVLAGLGLVGLAYLLGNIQGFGLIAAMIMTLTLQIFFFSRLSITDMSLNFFISACITFFYLGYSNQDYYKRKFAFHSKTSSNWFISLFLMSALGVLCKGPIAILLPGLVIVPFLLWHQDLKSTILDARREILVGLVGFLALALPWYIVVHFATGGAFTMNFFVHHNFERYTSTVSNHHGPIWFYIPVVLAGFFPWTFCLPQSLMHAVFATRLLKDDIQKSTKLLVPFCLWWATIVFLFFSASSTKLVTYILPILLPLVILCAKWWQDKFEVKKSHLLKNLDALIGLALLLIFSVGGSALALFVYQDTISEHCGFDTSIPIMILGLIFFSFVSIAMTAILKKPKISFGFLATGIALVYFVSVQTIIIPLGHYLNNGSKEFLTTLEPQAQVYSLRKRRTAFYFYRQAAVPALKFKELYNSLDTSKEIFYFIANPKDFNDFRSFVNENNLKLNKDVSFKMIKERGRFIWGSSLQNNLTN